MRGRSGKVCSFIFGLDRGIWQYPGELVYSSGIFNSTAKVKTTHFFSGIKYSSKHSKKFVEVIKYKIKPVLW